MTARRPPARRAASAARTLARAAVGFPTLAGWLEDSAGQADAAWRDGAFTRVLDFGSGANEPADAEGHAMAGQPFGVSAGTCSEACERAVLRLSDYGVPVFVDSGAFSEHTGGAPITPAQWADRLRFYGEVAALYGPRATLVAPDKLGDQAASLSRLQRYAAEVGALLDAGARVVVPLQLGGARPVDAARAVDAALGRTDWTPGIPFNRVPMPLEDVLDLVRERRPAGLHFLGLGAFRRGQRGAVKVLDAVRRADPGLVVTMDSNKLRAKFGRTGRVRPGTAEQDRLGAAVAERRRGGGLVDDGLEVPDYTDLIAEPQTWATPAAIRAFCKEMRWVDTGDPLKGEDRRACRRRLDQWLQTSAYARDPSGPSWMEQPPVEAGLDSMWDAFIEAEAAGRIRRLAVARSVEGPTAKKPRKLSKRLVLVPATTADINDYVTQRHYLHRPRTMAQLGYWVMLDVPREWAETHALRPATQKGKRERWELDGQPIMGALHYATPRVSKRLYGYDPVELLELARMYLEPDEGGRNIPHLASAAIGASLRKGRLYADWRQRYPNLAAPKGVVSWADTGQGHEGAIYKAAGFVRVGTTKDRRPKSRRAAAGRETGTERTTVRHADTETPKVAWMMPAVPPDPDTTYWVSFHVQGLSKAGAEAMYDHLSWVGASVGLVRPKLDRRTFYYLRPSAEAELVIPLTFAEDAEGAYPARALEALNDAAADWVFEEAGEGTYKERADGSERWIPYMAEGRDGPFVSWEVRSETGGTYAKERGGQWDIVPAEQYTDRAPLYAFDPDVRLNPQQDAAGGDWIEAAAGWAPDDRRRRALFGLSGRAHVDAVTRQSTVPELSRLRDWARRDTYWRLPGEHAQIIESATHQLRIRSPEPTFNVPPGRRLDQLARANGMLGLANLLADENVAVRDALGLGDSSGPDQAEPGRIGLFNMGLGRDSVTMLLLLLEGRLIAHGRPVHLRDVDAIVFSDTGAEWDHTYQIGERVRALAEMHGLRYLHLRKPPEDVWRPWAEEQRRLRLAKREGSEEVWEREVVPLVEVKRGRLEALRADRAAEVREATTAFNAVDEATPRIRTLEAENRSLGKRKSDTPDVVAWKQARKQANNAELKALRDARKARTKAAVAPIRARYTAEIEEIKRVHKATVRKLMAEWLYTAPQASWAYVGDSPEERANRGAYQLRPPILDDFGLKDTIMLRSDKSCTANHKVLPIRRVMGDLARRRFGDWAATDSEAESGKRTIDNGKWSALVRKGVRPPHINLIGIAADETSRLEKGGDQGCFSADYVTEAFPLAELGIAKEHEDDTLRRYGYEIVAKSGCWSCPHQPVSWWWALSEVHPERFALAEHYEQQTFKRDPVLLFVGDTPLREAVRKWRAENPDATVEAVLAKSYAKACKAPLRQNPGCPRCAAREDAMRALGLAPVLPFRESAA